MGIYIKKPIGIKAIQLRWDTWSEMCDFIDVGELTNNKPEGAMDGEKIGLNIPTLEGLIHADENDYIIKENQREIYSCNPAIFKETYEEVIL